MQYESQIKKILKVTQNENQTSFDKARLAKYTWMPRPENFRKQVGVISLCKGFAPATGNVTADGFVNPLVTILAGIPTITPPPLVIPVLMDYQPVGTPVVIPNGLLGTATTLILVASTDNYTVVPSTEDELTNLNITLSASGDATPIPLSGTPTLLAPGVMSIPLSANETNVLGNSPTLTINFNQFASDIIGTSMTLQLSSPTTVTAPISPPSISTDGSALGNSPIGNVNVTPAIGQFPAPLINLNTTMGIQTVAPNLIGPL